MLVAAVPRLLRALRDRLVEAETRFSLGQAFVSRVTQSPDPDLAVLGAGAVHTLCIQCGPNVSVDADGWCLACGCDARPEPTALVAIREALCGPALAAIEQERDALRTQHQALLDRLAGLEREWRKRAECDIDVQYASALYACADQLATVRKEQG